MKVGLLLCDHVRPAFRDEFGDYPAIFQRAWSTFDFEVFAVCDGQFPSSVDICDAYIATGSSHSVYEELDWIIQLQQFIRDIHQSEKYFLGVCFGHQLLAAALGGEVKKAQSGWSVGIQTFTISQQEAWMDPFQPQLNLLMMCQDQVHVLPPNATVLASTPACPVGIFRVGQRMLGVQAHPEFSKAYDQLLMETRIDRMGAKTVEQGVASLSLPLDAEKFIQWTLRFLSALD